MPSVDLLCAFHVLLHLYFTKPHEEGSLFPCFTDERVSQSLGGLGTFSGSHNQEQWDQNSIPGSLIPKPALYTTTRFHQGNAKPMSSATVTSSGVSFRSGKSRALSRIQLASLFTLQCTILCTAPAYPCATSGYHLHVTSLYTFQFACVTYQCPILTYLFVHHPNDPS